jgi:hypothetical protein
LAAADERAWGATLFLGHETPLGVDELCRGLAGAVHRPYRPLAIPVPLMRLAATAGELVWRLGGRPMIDRARLLELLSAGFVCGVDQASSRIGFTASIGWAEGAGETAQWYREHNWL